jgi:iron complex transport system ATP-binding protein
MLEVTGLSAGYSRHRVLEDLSLAFPPGQVTGIIGPNGVGKSTLLKCLIRALKPQEGSIRSAGRDIFSMKWRELARLQAYVPQGSALTFPLTALEYIELGRRPYVSWALSETDRRIIRETMTYLRIDAFADKHMDEISGGERQKIMLARAMAQEPKILLLDEPTSALDIRHQINVMRLLRRIAAERDCTVVTVMHDLSLVVRYCDHVALMHRGRIRAAGAPAKAITAEHLREVYGVTADIMHTSNGIVVVPEDPQEE